jgi:hypothetical protein
MAYLDEGGKLYIEGSITGYWINPSGSYYSGLWDYLGCSYLGYDVPSNVSELYGQEAWPGLGLAFGFPSGTGASDYVDKLDASGEAAFLQIIDQQNRGRTVSNIEGRAAFRTILSSVVFAGFTEGYNGVSTQENYMERLVAFLLNDDQIAPEALSDASAEPVGADLVLTWSPVTNDVQGGEEALDSYCVERGMSIAGPWTYLALCIDTSYSDAPDCLYDPSENCFYRIRAVDTAGNMGAGGFVGAFDFQADIP